MKTPDWLIKIMKRLDVPVTGDDKLDRAAIANSIGHKTIKESIDEYIKRG